ncbi:MAG: hypothetical protein LBG21_05425 [Campylobacteraceae bacterium]|jgi:ADP-heptose:LPS heptosyltransferase|nr:hypothetical protein [Campylobacteraceae bacterium]
MKILLLSFRSYGDCIITLKLIEYLSSNNNVQIDIFTRSQFEPFFRDNTHINHIFLEECLLAKKGMVAKLSLISHFRFFVRK